MYLLWNKIIIFYVIESSFVYHISCDDNTIVWNFITQTMGQQRINELKNDDLYKQSLNNSVQLIEEYKKQYSDGLENDENYLNVTHIIRKYGYPVEEHIVVTLDGYALQILRIPQNGTPVFLMHGLTSASDDWITAGPSSGLGFLLAENNYDVWMGNARGTKDLKQNLKFKKSEKKFWDFSWHEIGVYDVPCMIDYVLEITKQKSLIYIGHSQGSTVFYVMNSIRPEYNHKVSLMISLSAVAWSSQIRSPFVKALVPIKDQLYNFTTSTGIYKLYEKNSLTEVFEKIICNDLINALVICENIGFLIAGFNYAQTDFRRFPVINNHHPSATSVKQFIHYLQIIKSGRFQQFDYDSENMLKYGSLEPPSYPVENITTPVAIFFSDGDWLATRTDVAILESKLQNVVDFYKIPEKTYNHIDFIFGKENKVILLPKILKLIQIYS